MRRQAHCVRACRRRSPSANLEKRTRSRCTSRYQGVPAALLLALQSLSRVMGEGVDVSALRTGGQTVTMWPHAICCDHPKYSAASRLLLGRLEHADAHHADSHGLRRSGVSSPNPDWRDRATLDTMISRHVSSDPIGHGICPTTPRCDRARIASYIYSYGRSFRAPRHPTREFRVARNLRLAPALQPAGAPLRAGP